MEGRWKGISMVLVILAASGSSYQIIEGPKNVTALEGSEARFNCTVSQGWKLIMWTLNDTVVLSITPSEPIITDDRFTPASYEEGGNFVSEMIIHDVQLQDTGYIKCSLQSSDRDASAFLSVQVMGELLIPGGDLTVPEDEPCNVTCYARGWIPLPGISWEIGVSVNHSSYYSFPEPDDLQSAVSILTLTPQGNGILTCVATMQGLPARKSVSVNLTVVRPSEATLPSGIADTQTADGTRASFPATLPMTLNLSCPHPSLGRTSLPTWAIILLAVSFSLLLILIIVLIIIICCCCISGREKKESSYQSEIRKSPSVKTNKETFETNLKSGSENLSYCSDELKTAKLASSAPVSSESRVQEQYSNRQPYQVPERRWWGSAGRPQVSFFMASPRTIRNVTLV